MCPHQVPDTSGALPRESRDNYGPTAGGGLDVAAAVPSADVDASAPLASSAGMSGERIERGRVLLPWFRVNAFLYTPLARSSCR